ncbi:Ig-like domain repeat protein [Candidatus Margulisiibacteriota bacterium]
MKKLAIFIFFLLVTIMYCNSAQAETPIKSYKNYLIVMVHGISSSAEDTWYNGEGNDLKRYLEKDLNLKGYVYAYDFDDPYGAPEAEGRELGMSGYQGQKRWLDKARDDFVAWFRSASGYGREPMDEEIPKKYILITHSMGGLAARSYIFSDTLAQIPSLKLDQGYYKNDVKKTVFITVPHTGSSMATFSMLNMKYCLFNFKHIVQDAIHGNLSSITEMKDIIKNLSVMDYLLGLSGDKLARLNQLATELEQVFDGINDAVNNNDAERLAELMAEVEDEKYEELNAAMKFMMADLIANPLGVIYFIVDSLNRIGSAPYYCAYPLVFADLAYMASADWIQGAASRAIYFNAPNPKDSLGLMQMMKDGPYGDYLEALKNAELPVSADPISFRNITAYGSIAYDDRNYKEDQWAELRYQLILGRNDYYFWKTLFSGNLGRMPHNQARLAALGGSLMRGEFTRNGDGAVQLDSQRGDGVAALNGVPQYNHLFSNSFSRYLDNGFIRDIDTLEKLIIMMDLITWGGVPPIVKGVIRLMPAIQCVIEFKYSDGEAMDTFVPHIGILKSKYSGSSLEQALFDVPEVSLAQMFISSNNVDYEYIPTFDYVEQANPYLRRYTVPVDYPMAGKIVTPQVYPVSLSTKAPWIKLRGRLQDFIPTLAQEFQYSLNFGNFKDITVEDDWGMFNLPPIILAEGQNIIAFRATNKLGRKTQQILRIIRSSTPLLPSEMHPVYESTVSQDPVQISFKLSDTKFLPEDTAGNIIELVDLKIDGMDIPIDSLDLRKEVTTYNYNLYVNYDLALAEGEHQLMFNAKDIYGHDCFGAWSFKVDRTVPSINIETEAIHSSSGSEENFKVHYNIEDNTSHFLKNISVVIKRADNEIVAKLVTADRLSAGNHYAEWDGQKTYALPANTLPYPVVDGEYKVVVSAADEAGNVQEAFSTFNIDNKAPEFISAEISPEEMSTAYEEMVFKANLNEKAWLRIKLHNVEEDYIFNYGCSTEKAGSEEQGQYIWDFIGNNDILPDGHYEIMVYAEDVAGNISQAPTLSVLIDRAPPVIFGNYADPFVIANSGTNPYQTILRYRVKDNTPTGSSTEPIKIDISVKSKSTGVVVNTYSDTVIPEIENTYLWDAAGASISRGVYMLELIAEDKYGNKSLAISEVIKEGMLPIVMSPAEGSILAQQVNIYGLISDADWTNQNDFEKYEVYWAAGDQVLPADLNNIPAFWQKAGISVPLNNQDLVNGEPNESYRPVSSEGLLAHWDIASLTNGNYSLLFLVSEKESGYTGGLVRHYTVDNSAAGYVVPKINIVDIPVAVDLGSGEEISINYLVSRKNANVNIELVDDQGRLRKTQNYLNVAANNFYAKPSYDLGAEKGIFIWEDESGWHFRANGELNGDYILAGQMIGSFKDISTVGLAAGELTQGVAALDFEFTVQPGEEKGFDLKMNSDQLIMILREKIGEVYSMFSTNKIFFGVSRYSFQANPIIAALPQADVASWSWDGVLDNGAIAASGNYRLYLTASGTDGQGYVVATADILISSPFEFTLDQYAPADKKIDVFSEIDRISAQYKLNKDAYVTAKVYDANDSTEVCMLLDREVKFGQAAPHALYWQGAFPSLSDSQRKVSGDYYIQITAEPLDNCVSSANIMIPSIQLIQNSGTALANIDPIGSPIEFNSATVQAAEGSSRYSWSAFAKGKYYQPKPFSYRLETTGIQNIKAFPFVPFAGLAHRRMNKVDVKVRVKIHARERKIRNMDCEDYNYSLWKSSASEVNGLFTINTQNVNVSGGLQCNQPEENGDYYLEYPGISGEIVAHDGVLIDKFTRVGFGGSTGGYKEIVSDKGIFKLSVTVGRVVKSRYHRNADCNDVAEFYFSGNVELLDSVEYSRLTNRFYAWFGWINKNHPYSFDFKSKCFGDLGTLGFPGTGYFLDSDAYLASCVRSPVSYADNIYIEVSNNASWKDWNSGPNIVKPFSGESERIYIHTGNNPYEKRINQVCDFTSLEKINSVSETGISIIDGITVKQIATMNIPAGKTAAPQTIYTNDGRYMIEYRRELLSGNPPFKDFVNTSEIVVSHVFRITDLHPKAEVVDLIRPEVSGNLVIAGASFTAEGLSITDNELLMASMISENVRYEHYFKIDPAVYNYLGDEEFNFYPITVPMDGGFEFDDITGVATVYSDHQRQNNLSWPIDPAEIDSMNMTELSKVRQLASYDDINRFVPEEFPYLLNISELDFGGPGSTYHDIFTAIAPPLTYESPVSLSGLIELPESVDQASVRTRIVMVSPNYIDVTFSDGTIDTAHLNNPKVVANDPSATGAGSEWSTALDPLLPYGVIDSQLLTFNADTFSPISQELYISDAYPFPSQDVMISGLYTFVADKNSANVVEGEYTNQNLQIDNWDIALYDEAGEVNKDLSPVDIQLNNKNIAGNKFKVKLNLDAVEKKFVKIYGQANGAYELLYFSGTIWEEIVTSSVPASGLLTHWDVSRLNGLYTVVLKVYDADQKATLATTEVYIGKKFKVGEVDPENLRITTPYKRAELYFKPDSYTEDTFLTIVPVKLTELSLKNKPDLAPIGPIAQILPHSEFATANRPTLVYKFSSEDMVALQDKGTDITKLNIYYVNKDGDLELAESTQSWVEDIYQITAQLDHFSPYTLLDGIIPQMPSVYAARIFSGAVPKVKIYGKARPNSELEVIVDEQAMWNTKNITLSEADVDIGKWILNSRSFNADYLASLSEEERAQVLSGRQEVKIKTQEVYVSENKVIQSVEQVWVDGVLVNAMQAEEVKTYLGQSVVTDNLLFVQPGERYVTHDIINNPTVNELALGVMEATTLDINEYLPEQKTLVISQEERPTFSSKSQIYKVWTNADGLYELELGLAQSVPTYHIYVTYEKTDEIKNRPVAYYELNEQSGLPQIQAIAEYPQIIDAAQKEQGISINVTMSEQGKVLLLDAVVENNSEEPLFFMTNDQGEVRIDLIAQDLLEGLHRYTLSPINEQGEIGLPALIEFIVDTEAPEFLKINAPVRLNPEHTSLNITCELNEAASLNISILDMEGVTLNSGELTTENIEFAASVSGNEYLNVPYVYQIEAVDIAGNATVVSGSFVIDTISPQPITGLKLIPNDEEILLSWQNDNTEPLASYILYRKNIKTGEEVLIDVLGSNDIFVDTSVAEHAFYEYSVVAQDQAKNQSVLSDKKVICAVDCSVQGWSAVSAGIKLQVNLAKMEHAYDPQQVLPERYWILKEVKNNLRGSDMRQKIVGNPYLVMSHSDLPLVNALQVELYFDQEDTELLEKESIKIVKWTGSDWQDTRFVAELTDPSSYKFTTLEEGTYAIAGDLYAWAFDGNVPQIRLLNDLANDDYFTRDPIINIAITDDKTALDLSSARLYLNGVEYVLPQNMFNEISEDGLAATAQVNIAQIVGSKLNPGKQDLRITILDEGENLGSLDYSFIVSGKLEIKNVYNAPNPCGAEGTYFTYQLGKAADVVDLKIYDLQGRLIKEFRGTPGEAGFNKIFWNLNDDQGFQVPNDVYIYVVVAKADGKVLRHKGKVAVLR